MDEALKEKIIKSIEKSGYPTELKVGNQFIKKGWNTSHNRYYLDKDEQKGREIDVMAYLNRFHEDKGFCLGLHVVASVKQSLEKPWIIFSTESRKIEFIGGYSRMYYSLGIELPKVLTYEEVEKESGFHTYQRVGRSYTEGFTKTESLTIFSALTGVVKAAEHCLEVNKEAGESWHKGEEKSIEFIEPIIIFNGKLYEAFLNEKDDIEIMEANRLIVSFGYISSRYKRYNYGVQIITFSELPKYISQKENWINELDKIIINKL